MSVLTKRLWSLASLARAPLCTKRAAISVMLTKPKKALKIHTTCTRPQYSYFVQYRCYNDNSFREDFLLQWQGIADELLAQERYSEALQTYNSLLAIKPTRLNALLGKLQCSLELKNFQVALDCISAVIRLNNPETIKMDLGLRASIRLDLEQYDSAVEDLLEVRKLGSEFSRDFQDYLKRICFRCDKFGPKSIQLLLAALKKMPNEPEIYHLIAYAHYLADNYVEAKEYAFCATKLAPNNADYFVLLAEITLKLKDWTLFSSTTDKVIEIGSRNTEEYIWQLKFEAEGRLQNCDKAERAFNQAFEHIVNPTDEFLGIGGVMAVHFRDLDHREVAARLLEKIASFRRPALNQFALGFVLSAIEAFLKINRLADITARYKNVLELSESHVMEEEWRKEMRDTINWRCPIHIAQLHDARGEYKNALALYTEVIGCYKDQVELVNTVSRTRITLLIKMGRLQEALAALDELKVSPEDLTCHRVAVLSELGRFDEASALIERAMAKGGNADHFFVRGLLLRRRGQLEEALYGINVAITRIENGRNSKDGWISGHDLNFKLSRLQLWLERATLLEELNRPDEAIAAYEDVLKICPEEPNSLVRLAKLYSACRAEEVQRLLPELSKITPDSESLRKEAAEIVAQNNILVFVVQRNH